MLPTMSLSTRRDREQPPGIGQVDAAVGEVLDHLVGQTRRGEGGVHDEQAEEHDQQPAVDFAEHVARGEAPVEEEDARRRERHMHPVDVGEDEGEQHGERDDHALHRLVAVERHRHRRPRRPRSRASIAPGSGAPARTQIVASANSAGTMVARV